MRRARRNRRTCWIQINLSLAMMVYSLATTPALAAATIDTTTGVAGRCNDVRQCVHR